MLTGRARIHWYDIIVLPLAAAIVYPDVVLDWLSEMTGKILGWWHLLAVELAAIGLMIVAMVLLMPVYPKLDWWYPLLMVGLIAAVRFGVWLVTRLFDFDD